MQLNWLFLLNVQQRGMASGSESNTDALRRLRASVSYHKLKITQIEKQVCKAYVLIMCPELYWTHCWLTRGLSSANWIEGIKHIQKINDSAAQRLLEVSGVRKLHYNSQRSMDNCEFCGWPQCSHWYPSELQNCSTRTNTIGEFFWHPYVCLGAIVGLWVRSDFACKSGEASGG